MRSSSRIIGVASVTAVAVLVAAATASAHSSISPPVAQAKTLQAFTLELQAEKESVKTVRVEITVPDGFAIETFPASPGWTRKVTEAGSGEGTHVTRVVWTGAEPTPRDDPVFHFTGTLQHEGTFAVKVRQVYADGTLTDWTGQAGSEQPAAYIRAVKTIGGGGTSTLAVISVALAAVALLVSVLALVSRSGRPLT